MKFLASVAAVAAVASVASAQTLQISNPTTGVTWQVGGSGYISWSGNCANLGNASHSVDVQLMTGPATALRYVADLTTIDCSGNTTSTTVTVPSTLTPGNYSLQILTSPTDSYSAIFAIAGGASSTSAAPAPPAASTTKAPSGSAGSVVTAPLMAVAGCVALAVGQLLL
ncbi:hypothetical protein EMPS_06468 [Entomortierella parvispora]|uniref:Yeast cell wall synthesis Kre9/Knh1-like N-terminal domain-containing protein n=1 Tax=Entomortierella parvispora TaxID=205924 RepID=A0A9P3LXS0_9FUNG|nr:hypothetical protein EMPS_06468 [Entomortierella parvispora]